MTRSELDAGLYQYRCRVLRVVDGDTVIAEIDLGCHVLIVREVRLVGINTPECNSKDPAERARAEAAKHRLNSLVGFGFPYPPSAWIRTELDRGDKYGRLLGGLYVAATDVPLAAVSRDTIIHVNAVLVAEGHAVAYDGGRR